MLAPTRFIAGNLPKLSDGRQYVYDERRARFQREQDPGTPLPGRQQLVVRPLSKSLEIPKAGHLISDAVTNELLPQLLLRFPRAMLVLAGEVRHLVPQDRRQHRAEQRRSAACRLQHGALLDDVDHGVAVDREGIEREEVVADLRSVLPNVHHGDADRPLR